MKLLLLALLLPVLGSAQDSLFSFVRVYQFDGISKADIYDKAQIWCSKAFIDSKSAINVRDKESGLLGGKGFYKNYYKIPRKKKDSIGGVLYNDFHLDWLIEVKDGKLRVSLTNFNMKETYGTFIVTTSDRAPYKLPLLSKERLDTEWQCAIAYLKTNLDELCAGLQADIRKPKDNW